MLTRTAEERNFREIHDSYRAFVRRTALRLGVPEASLDDVCQDVFLAVFRRLPEFRGDSALSTWICQFVHGVVANYHRTLRRKSSVHRGSDTLVDPDTLQAAEMGPDERASRTQELKRAHSLVAMLEPERREAFLLAEIRGLTAAEIAAETKVNRNTIYGRLRAARKEVCLSQRRAVSRSTVLV